MRAQIQGTGETGYKKFFVGKFYRMSPQLCNSVSVEQCSGIIPLLPQNIQKSGPCNYQMKFGGLRKSQPPAPVFFPFPTYRSNLSVPFAFAAPFLNLWACLHDSLFVVYHSSTFVFWLSKSFFGFGFLVFWFFGVLVFFLVFGTWSHFIVQTGLELCIPGWPQTRECWDYRCLPPCLADCPNSQHTLKAFINLLTFYESFTPWAIYLMPLSSEYRSIRPTSSLLLCIYLFYVSLSTQL